MSLQHLQNHILNTHGFVHNNPVFSAVLGLVTTLLFSIVDIPRTTLELEFACTIIKFVGITAGSTVAVASFIVYARKNWFPNRKQSKKKHQ
jgi:hypothetical protein